MKQLLLFLLCISVFTSKAQNGFTTYTANLSLTGTLKRQVGFEVDNAGNTWLAFNTVTAGNVGLVKHNNTNWTLYNTSSTPALPTNSLTAMTKDNNGNIWLGSSIGLIKFDGINFTTLTTVNGLLNDTINSLTNFGNKIYISTARGLSVYDGVNFTNYMMPGLKKIAVENANTFWVPISNSSVNYGITKVDISGALPAHTNYTLSTQNIGTINKIHVDAQGKKWIATFKGVFTFDGTTIENITDKFDVFGDYASGAGFIDICDGLNGGVIIQTQHLSTTMSGNSSIPQMGMVEITPQNEIFQYFFPSNMNFSTCDFATNGNKLLISTGNYNVTNSTLSTPINSSTLFYGFDKSSYTVPFGAVTVDNYKTLDINNVKAAIANRSDMHWEVGGNGSSRYQVPKVNGWAKGRNTNFATALWIGGLDNSNQLHIGAQTYRQFGCDFWPGPLTVDNATTDSVSSIAYDKIWKVNLSEISDLITNYNNGTLQGGGYNIPKDILTWPGNGDVSHNYDLILAPFVDVNGDGVYDPYAGDYPKIKGDQALYFIYNDKLSPHQSTGSQPLGVEVHVMAYAYGCPDVLAGKPELDFTTFYDYKIINRSTSSYHDMYTTLWSDVDLGYFADDYIGCNVADNYGYAFNGDSDDETAAGINGYGKYLPAQGFAILKGPMANNTDGIDNDNDGTIDEPNEECLLNKFTYFNNSLPGTPAQTTDPTNGQEYYNIMSIGWKDGTPLTCGGNGYGGTIPTNWVFSGDPANGGNNTDPNNLCGNWMETSLPSDRRLLMSCGPFNLAPGEVQEVEYAFVTSFDSTQLQNNTLSVTKLKTDIQKIRAFYNWQNKPNCFTNMNVGVQEEEKQQDDFIIYPNPANDYINVRKAVIDGKVELTYELVDMLGKPVLSGENNNGEFTINIKGIDAGVYFLRLNIKDNIVVKKIIKE